MAGTIDEKVQKVKCMLCGSYAKKADCSGVDICDECERIYHLGETAFGLDEKKLENASCMDD